MIIWFKIFVYIYAYNFEDECVIWIMISSVLDSHGNPLNIVKAGKWACTNLNCIPNEVYIPTNSLFEYIVYVCSTNLLW